MKNILSNKNKIIIALLALLVVSVLSYGGYVTFFKRAENVQAQNKVYTCPMHPQIISDHPGQCPICGMTLVLKTTELGSEIQTKQDTTVKDLMEVKLSPSQQVLANVQTMKVGMKQFSGEKTFNGYIKVNEKNFSQIATPVAGKIVKLYVNFEGETVGKGQPVAEIYSPDLVATQKEYLIALDNYNQVQKSGNEFATEQASSLLESARMRLRYWELTPEQIGTLEKTREIKYSSTIYSKYSGVITKKYFNVGHWAMAGEAIFDLDDLSTVWVIANIYESDIQYIKSGQTAEIYSSAYPDEVMNAKINFVNPVFNPDSRTLEVRIDVANRNYKLKPDMYVKVKINTYVNYTLAVPKNAVIRTGERNVVYVQKESGVYVPREVQISYEQDGYYAVTSGLKDGDIVVSSGGFLIDSESQIQMGMTSGHEGHNMNTNNDEDNKINPGQDIMKDMDQKNQK
jgi:Cu(I)/Ag(I) efflux system membrane fusion protein